VFQDSEIVTLLFTLATLPVLPMILRGLELPGKRWFVGGFVAMTSAYVFTVAEGIAWSVTFNFLEHMGYTVAGVCMLAGVLALTRVAPRGRVG
jgi:hypothetical protein